MNDDMQEISWRSGFAVVTWVCGFAAGGGVAIGIAGHPVGFLAALLAIAMTIAVWVFS